MADLKCLPAVAASTALALTLVACVSSSSEPDPSETGVKVTTGASEREETQPEEPTSIPSETVTGPESSEPAETGTEPDASAETSGGGVSEHLTGSPSRYGARPGPVDRRISRMSLRDKARQLVAVAFSGTTAPGRLIRTLHPGGLIYFSDNVQRNAQIRAMSARVQRIARRTGEPLLLMTDQEGGLVTRLPGTSDVPGGAEFGGDARWARRTAKRTGELMDRLGIGVNLAPIADVNTVGNAGVIGSRSFSSDPDVASRLVRAQVCGYHAGGIATTVKHFPGHGSTATDSHASTATITKSRSAWRRTDLPPFASAVRARVDLIMLGHLALPAFDPSGRPATISPQLNRRLLRERLGYEGVVVSDALNMGGITSWGSSRQIAVRAIKSGVDLLLMPPQPAEAVRGVVEAVRDGRLSERRLNASVERVLALKQRLGLYRAAEQLPRC